RVEDETPARGPGAARHGVAGHHLTGAQVDRRVAHVEQQVRLRRLDLTLALGPRDGDVVQLVLLDAVDLRGAVELVELLLRPLEVAVRHVRPHQLDVAVLLRTPDRPEALGHPFVQVGRHLLLPGRRIAIGLPATEYPHTGRLHRGRPRRDDNQLT